MQFSILKPFRAGLLFLIMSFNIIYATNLIIMRVQPSGPDNVTAIRQEKVLKTIATPGAISRKILRRRLLKSGTYDGIFATYGGYLAVSDYDGSLFFPRSHVKPEVKIVVTPTVAPIFMFNNIIHHWEFDPTQPAAMYIMTMQQDPNTKLYYWNTQSTSLPKDKRLPLDSILLFAKPQNIIVPTGMTLTQKSGHLVLPPVFATKELNRLARAVTVQDIRIFFEPVRYDTQKTDDELYLSRQITNH